MNAAIHRILRWKPIDRWKISRSTRSGRRAGRRHGPSGVAAAALFQIRIGHRSAWPGRQVRDDFHSRNYFHSPFEPPFAVATAAIGSLVVAAARSMAIRDNQRFQIDAKVVIVIISGSKDRTIKFWDILLVCLSCFLPRCGNDFLSTACAFCLFCS